MTGIFEAFALFETVSGIGFLARWRNQHLARRFNCFHAPQNRKSPIDRLIQAQTGPVVMHVDESRVSQIHSTALERLRATVNSLLQPSPAEASTRTLSMAAGAS